MARLGEGGPLRETRSVWVGQGGRGAVWRCYDEVFDLARDGDAVLAATNGGLLRDGRPVPSPAGLRTIEGTAPLVVGLADGRWLKQENGRWLPTTPATRPRDLDHGLALDDSAAWPTTPPPPAHPYAALRLKNVVLAGTDDGLYRYAEGRWTRQNLSGELPLARPNGIGETGGTYVVGGLGGLFVGRPGAWQCVWDDAIRQVTTVGGEVWAVHGNGALDRLDPAADRLYPDVLVGSARRPWTSCVGSSGNAPIFGGQGGWQERAGVAHFPAELRGDVVTAATGVGTVRWIGTQKAGLLRYDGKGVRRWNPGNGLSDTWVTALASTPDGLVVGTARRGLFRLTGSRMVPLAGPTERVTALSSWGGTLIVGGMDGAWIRAGSAWRDLGTSGEETTSIAPLRGGLAITTAAGVFFVNGQLSSSQSVR